jgi:pimeloyl-ACP methyl ester carboxylesterase
MFAKVRKRLLTYAIFAIVLWFTSSFVVVFALTRRVGGHGDEPAPSVPWGKFDELHLATRDGQELGAWFLEGNRDQPIVLLLHGIGARRTLVLEQATFFAEERCGLLLISMRGHGDSTGERNDFGYSSRHDVVAAIDWIEKRQPGRRIVVWGTSLGAATALFAAGELGDRVHGYWLECAFQDLPTAARNRTKHFLPMGVEWVAYQGLNMMGPVFLPEMDEIAPVKAADAFPRKVPSTVAAGALDFLAMPCESCAIAERMGPAARLVIFEKSPHSLLHRAEPARYRAEIRELLGRVGS